MTNAFWQRAIILVDMNAFFASVEQLDFPRLRGKPVAVTNGAQGTCIITASYEARTFGIKTGVRLKEALQRCPSLQVVPSRPKRYAEVSTKIMSALQEITPDIEVFSIDEAFLDVTHCQSLWGSPEVIAVKTKQLVKSVSGLDCSVGVSSNKTTAKFAAKQQKPNGLTIIYPEKARSILAPFPVTDLCGIGKGIGEFLAERGVIKCGDMQHLPISVLAKRFGNLGRRIWHMCQGSDPEPLSLLTKAPKSLGHGKVMPPDTRDENLVKIYLRHMSEKVAARLRCNKLESQSFFIGFRFQRQRIWLAEKVVLEQPTQHGQDIYESGVNLLKRKWRGEGLCQLQVTALQPQPENIQVDLFAGSSEVNKINDVIDKINQRYGQFTVMPATLLDRTEMHDVIAPAWRPGGTRRSV